MQIEAGVGELDVASIQKGQAVRFTLESLPGRSFTGEVETLRMVPVVSNSVVSYTVIVKVENQDGTLLPGMTCAVDFIVERSEDVLTVSNAALRYQPSNISAEKIADMVFEAGLANMTDEQRQAAIEARAAQTAQAAANSSSAQSQNTGLAGMVMGAGNNRQMQAMSGGGGRQRQQGAQQGGQRRERSQTVVMRNLWYVNGDGKLEVMRVRAGISNGSSTEISSRDEIEGKQVILREKI
jgi:HlyD family secretion protein